jgi:NAD+-dependent secondary alcohol dehydrogenase Adh1
VRAVRLTEYGTAPSVEEVDEPKLTGPFDVIVQTAAAGVCRTDLHIIAGQLAEAGTSLPLTLGHETAGWIREVGSEVTNVSPGDLVLLHPTPTCGLCAACRDGDDMLCADSSFPGIFHDGGMAELVRTNARACVRLAADTDPVVVAAHADAGLTAYHAVKRALPLLPPGTSCAVLGVGGLGHVGIQCLATLTACRIIACDARPAALELAQQLGAHHVVAAGEGYAEAIRAASGGDGVDVVLDFVGEGGTEKDWPAMVRRGGHYFAVGYGGALDVPTFTLILNEISIVGNLVGSYRDLTELVALHGTGEVQLHTVTFPLEGVGEALAQLEAGTIEGRAVLVP